MTPSIRRRLPRGRAARAVVISLLCLGAESAAAQSPGWSAYVPIGNDLSASFKQVDRETWTWTFRNDASRKLVSLEYEYTDSKGDHHDILPVSLAPGKSFGGWAAFMGSSKPSRMRILKIKYEGDAAATVLSSGSGASETTSDGARRQREEIDARAERQREEVRAREQQQAADAQRRLDDVRAAELERQRQSAVARTAQQAEWQRQADARREADEQRRREQEEANRRRSEQEQRVRDEVNARNAATQRQVDGIKAAGEQLTELFASRAREDARKREEQTARANQERATREREEREEREERNAERRERAREERERRDREEQREELLQQREKLALQAAANASPIVPEATFRGLAGDWNWVQQSHFISSPEPPTPFRLAFVQYSDGGIGLQGKNSATSENSSYTTMPGAYEAAVLRGDGGRGLRYCSRMVDASKRAGKTRFADSILKSGTVSQAWECVPVWITAAGDVLVTACVEYRSIYDETCMLGRPDAPTDVHTVPLLARVHVATPTSGPTSAPSPAKAATSTQREGLGQMENSRAGNGVAEATRLRKAQECYESNDLACAIDSVKADVAVDATNRDRDALFVLSLGMRTYNAAMKSNKPEDFNNAILLLKTSDEISPSANAAFATAVSAYWLVQHFATQLQTSKTCADAKAAQDALLQVNASMPRGASVNAITAKQLLDAAGQMERYLTAAAKNYCH